MALSDLSQWNVNGSSCGASDKPEEQPAACGADDKPAEQPAACGASDK